MSNSLFQNVIDRMKGAVDRVIGVADESSVILACSDTARIGDICPGAQDRQKCTNDVRTADGLTCCPMDCGGVSDFVVFVEGEDEMARTVSGLLAVSLGTIGTLAKEPSGLPAGGSGKTREDPQYAEAVRIAVESGQISTAALQRKIGAGYARCAKLIDRMEAEGIVSGQNGTKPREVLLSAEQYIARFACDNGENE